jgi:DNA-binding IclR family transcriptional regulator
MKSGKAGTSDTAGSGGALTLDRGLRVLELLATEERDFTVAEIASELGMHRQAVYRLLTTLSAHHLATRSASGRYGLGLGVLRLSRTANAQLQRGVLPHLRRLASRLAVTAQCVVAEGAEAVTLSVVEPDDAIFHLSQRPGARHPLEQGASGLAILAGRPPSPDDSDEVIEARARGYVVTSGRLTPGAIGVAVPLRDSDGASLEASIGVVAMHDLDVEAAAELIMEAAAAIAAGTA